MRKVLERIGTILFPKPVSVAMRPSREIAISARRRNTEEHR
jgi:hypothetical protein